MIHFMYMYAYSDKCIQYVCACIVYMHIQYVYGSRHNSYVYNVYAYVSMCMQMFKAANGRYFHLDEGPRDIQIRLPNAGGWPKLHNTETVSMPDDLIPTYKSCSKIFSTFS